jgi:cytoplasmic iron level regulating protein YaaA (DUF328/UPF0246 family)
MQVRVLQERAGTRSIVSHMAKKTRGEVARELLTSRRDIRRSEDVARALERAFTLETTPPGRPGTGWTIDVIVHPDR